MRKQLLATALLTLSAIGIQTASAQNYQPFSRNLTYHFSAQNNIFALKIDSSYVQNGDSVFVFNDIARRVYSNNTVPCANGARYVVNGNNQFGQKMIKKPNGVYLFETIQGAQFEVRTNAAIGQSWPFRIGQTTTATLTAKTVDPVLTTTDSVLTLTLSTGEVIKLSKNYGFLKVPNFASYADSYFPTKELTFHALPEKQLGNSVNDPFNIFDFQPGDIFLYYYDEVLGSSGGSGPCFERWTRDEILSRTMNAAGTSITYQIQREILERGHGNPNAPSYFCTRPSVTTLYPTTTTSLTVSKSNALYPNFLSQHYYVPSNLSSKVVTGIHKNAAFNNRERIDLENSLGYQSACKTFNGVIDFGGRESYVVGLGKVRTETQSMGNSNVEILQGYQKNGVIYGNLRTIAQIMSVSKDKELAPAIAIFPNPAENDATLKFDQPLTSGKLTITVVNTLGQTALQQEFAEAPEQQVHLNLEKLAKGIYVVQAAQNGKTFTSRFVKQ